MTLQRLINELEEIKTEYGNLPVNYAKVNIDSGEVTFIEITEVLITFIETTEVFEFLNYEPCVILR